MFKVLKDEPPRPPRPGDFVKTASGETHRVSKTEEKNGDWLVYFQGGGSAYWKRDNITTISRDENFQEHVEDLCNRYGIEK
ncbi:MAG: hypothetical protein R3346_00580 [Candidatus Spechtbacterales bacterium]|nr:hypothetical protein [Candidatus Spechtbacterales bacterium]